MRLTDHLYEPGKAKAVIPMQVTNEDAFDGKGVDVGFQHLPAAALATVYQICVSAKVEGHA